jgi:hypothetical protein
VTRHRPPPLSTRSRVARRTAALLLAPVATLALVAGPAFADSGDDGEVLGETLSIGRAALIYVGIPLAIIGVIWLLASIPSMLGAPRYRPGVSWWAAPAWFNGPEADPAPASGTAVAASDNPADPTHLGGTSARW